MSVRSIDASTDVTNHSTITYGIPICIVAMPHNIETLFEMRKPLKQRPSQNKILGDINLVKYKDYEEIFSAPIQSYKKDPPPKKKGNYEGPYST